MMEKERDNKTAPFSWAGELLRCFSRKKTLRGAAAAFLAVLVSAVLGAALMIGVYAIPGQRAEENVYGSTSVFLEEGTYPRLYSWCYSRMDNWTDAIMLMTAVDEAGDGVVDRAMGNRHGRLRDDTPVDSLLGHYLDGKPFEYEFIYGRYWHGYLLLLKPLLSLADLRGIRLVNGCCQLALTALTVWLMVKRRLKRLIAPLLLTWLMLMPVALAKCLQFSDCYYLAVGGTAVLLAAGPDRSDGRAPAVFLFLGIATAFFDFLSYPLVTFGIPAVVWLAMAPEDPVGRRLGKLVKAGFGWVFGYAGMWASKWIVGSALTGADLLTDAANALGTRTSSVSNDGAVRFSFSSCLSDNINTFLQTPFSWLVLLFLLGAAGYCLLHRGRRRRTSAGTVVPYFLVGALPVLWYACTVNHSTVHFWFTNKALAVSVFALTCAAAERAWSARPDTVFR